MSWRMLSGVRMKCGEVSSVNARQRMTPHGAFSPLSQDKLKTGARIVTRITAMNLNRFFFRCTRCLFRFTADVEGLRPPATGPCPVCEYQWLKCLGATKGVLSIGVPCNDKCVFAEGPDCSCTCAGRNHGSRLLVPVIKNVVDFKRSFPPLEQAARLWSAFNTRIGEAMDILGKREHTGPADVLRFSRAARALYESQSWDHRKRGLVDLLLKLEVKESAFSPLAVVPRAPMLAESSGELFAWGEKWAGVSPQFRGHQFTIPAVSGISEAFSFSPA